MYIRLASYISEMIKNVFEENQFVVLLTWPYVSNFFSNTICHNYNWTINYTFWNTLSGLIYGWWFLKLIEIKVTISESQISWTAIIDIFGNISGKGVVLRINIKVKTIWFHSFFDPEFFKYSLSV